MTTINDLDDFKALEPFFRIIELGLDGLADGGHFFDLLAEDVVSPASSCSSTPHKVGSFRPELPAPTGTSRCSRSRIARSVAGVTTSTLSRSSTLLGAFALTETSQPGESDMARAGFPPRDAVA
jgi:hypothetical protein